MNRNRTFFRQAVDSLFPCFLALLLLAGSAGSSRAGEGGKSLAVGRIDSMPVRAEMLLRPLAAHLASRLGDLGFDGGKSVVAEGIPSMTWHLEEGTVDIVIASSYPTMRFRLGKSARPLLMASRHGLSEYRSYLFVRKESGIRSLEDLKGKTTAFSSPDSTMLMTSASDTPPLARRSAATDVECKCSCDAVHGCNTKRCGGNGDGIWSTGYHQ